VGFVVEPAKADRSPAHNHIVDRTTLALDREFRVGVMDDLALDGTLANDPVEA